jgi:hypothetical protein
MCVCTYIYMHISIMYNIYIYIYIYISQPAKVTELEDVFQVLMHYWGSSLGLPITLAFEDDEEAGGDALALADAAAHADGNPHTLAIADNEVVLVPDNEVVLMPRDDPLQPAPAEVVDYNHRLELMKQAIARFEKEEGGALATPGGSATVAEVLEEWTLPHIEADLIASAGMYDLEHEMRVLDRSWKGVAANAVELRRWGKRERNSQGYFCKSSSNLTLEADPEPIPFSPEPLNAKQKQHILNLKIYDLEFIG